MFSKASHNMQKLLECPQQDREAVYTASREVSVIGCGVFSPTARSARQLLDILLAGTAPPAARKRVLELEDLHAAVQLRPREVKKVDRFSLLAITAARAAMCEAGLDREEIARCGIVTGNMMCGWTFTEPQVRILHQLGVAAVSPYLATAWFPAAPQGQVTIHLQMQGFAKTITTDRCAGAQAIGLAFDRIRHGRSSLLLAGGVEAPVTEFVEAAFAQLHQSADDLLEAGAYLLLSAEGSGCPLIGEHQTFLVPQPDPFAGGIIERRLRGLASKLPDHLKASAVVCNIAANSEIEEKTALVVKAVFSGTNPRILYPTRAFGDCLAASGPTAAAIACSLLTEGELSRSVIVLSLGHQCADLLWIYRED